MAQQNDSTPTTSASRRSSGLFRDQLTPATTSEVTVVDPYVVDDHTLGVQRQLHSAQLATADAVLLLTNHPDFDPQLVYAHARYVLDTRRAIPPGDHIEHL